MITVLVTQASEWKRKEIREFQNLEECVHALYKEAKYPHQLQGIIITLPSNYWETLDDGIDYVAEIYDACIE